VSTTSELGTATTPGSADPDAVLDAYLESTEQKLTRVQHDTRLYLGGWMAANLALAGAQASVAVLSPDPAVRGNYWVGTGLAAAGIGVLLAQPWPGLGSVKKFKARPRGTRQEKIAAVAYGETLIAKQRNWDHIAVLPDKHIAAGVIALAAGLGVGFGFDSVREGLSRALGVLFVLELQIATRPGSWFGPKDPGRTDRPYLTFGPWMDRFAQGASVRATF
jgi:hypothetical protein